MRTKPFLGRKAWFGPRRMGWGLTPVTVEGWLVSLIAVVVAVCVASFAGQDRWMALIVVVVLLVVVFLKSTSPGGSEAWQEYQASKDRPGS